MHVDEFSKDGKLEAQDELAEHLQESDERLKDADPELISDVIAALLQLGNPEETTPAPSGDELLDASVETAGTQMDKGEEWEAYCEVNMDNEIPQSVEELANDTQNQKNDEEKRNFSVRDFQNHMAVQNGLLAC